MCTKPAQIATLVQKITPTMTTMSWQCHATTHSDGRPRYTPGVGVWALCVIEKSTRILRPSISVPGAISLACTIHKQQNNKHANVTHRCWLSHRRRWWPHWHSETVNVSWTCWVFRWLNSPMHAAQTRPQTEQVRSELMDRCKIMYDGLFSFQVLRLVLGQLG